MSFPNILWLDDLIFGKLRKIVNDEYTPGYILDIISRLPFKEIQQDITYHLNCQEKTLIRLSNSKNDFVLCGVYCNRKTPFYILEKLAFSGSYFIRRNMMCDHTLDRPTRNLRKAVIDLQFLEDNI